MKPTARPGTRIYVGLSLVALASLAYQLLLTRIFSVTLWYHFAFVAVSVAMFGLTAGAVLVYLRPRWFPAETAARTMGAAAAGMAALMVLTYLVHAQSHVTITFRLGQDTAGHFAAIAAMYAMLALPFVASGICVTIGLTRFPRHTGRLYAADLAGAALGCLAVATVSCWIDAPNLVLGTAMLAAGAALCFHAGRDDMWLRWSVVVSGLLLILGLINMTAAGRDLALFRPRWVKGRSETWRPVFERWNACSRVTVWEIGGRPLGWGISRRFTPNAPVPQKWLNIDAAAGTVLTRFTGDLAPLEHLRYDVTNMAHYLRRDGRVLVIGAGGGRDVLSALYFRQRHVVGVEVNAAVLETLTGPFGDFTGHLDRRPNVTLVHDEARSYLARCDQSFDILQASLVDTWAATAAGAYVLTENGLYTREAWELMLRRLSDRGVLTFSRWYSGGGPAQLYRMTALAVAALRQIGVSRPWEHLIVVCQGCDSGQSEPTGTATLLVCHSPFSDEDIDTVERVAKEMDFAVLLSPRASANRILRRLAHDEDLGPVLREYPGNIVPPTDDRPFFFDMVRLADVLSFTRPKDPSLAPSLAAITTLGMLMVAVIGLTVLCVLLPLALSLGRQSLAGSLPLSLYFCGIGLGFMFVEIVLIQRLTLVLGHPIYSIAVVLFCLLLASGAGSWLSDWAIRDVRRGWRAPLCLAAVAGAVLLTGLAVLPYLSRLDGVTAPARIGVAAGMLLPLGLLMGTAFPLGMRTASFRCSGLAPWLFGINGAMSICGSVGAVILSLSLGFMATMLIGAGCYAVAWLALVWARWPLAA